MGWRQAERERQGKEKERKRERTKESGKERQAAVPVSDWIVHGTLRDL